MNTFYTSNKKILRRNECDDDFAKFIKEYWESITNHMVPWKEMNEKVISKKELREQYIATQAVVIQAFGRVGAYLYDHRDYSISEYIPNIKKINWKRRSDDWKLRVIRSNGRMINNTEAIQLTANVIKRYLNLPLTENEQHAEEVFMKNIL